ncbi:LLM class flavin-dependent oxidoreductase [Rubrobacter calidifluminis]|uniref:LLM class flavin-dependent oxidoreductase n=1 Tax=Rubrobacter calidifluminis TaxID=1392640 RepID=UPI00235DF25F|nr:LLM class flavin-dependent oxidoreductase [Rubrobacter calidifluminis]
MRFGLSLSCQHLAGEDMVRRFEEHLEQTALARELGFDAVFYFEHFLMPEYQMLHQSTFLARVAAEAGHMKVGTGIMLLALHNPVEAADMISTLDVITNGKAIFGAGLGYREVEFEAFGVDKSRAIEVFEEKLDVIKRLWAGEIVRHTGHGFRLSGVGSNLRPVQRPHPPIWIGANSTGAVRRAARLGDAWFINPHAKLSSLEKQMPVYRQALEEAGKEEPETLPMSREVFIAESNRRAMELARPYLEKKYSTYVEWGQDKVMPHGDALALPFEELTRERFLIGDPETVAEELLEYERRLGVNFVILRLQWPGMDNDRVMEAIRLLGSEVIPRLRSERI